MSGLFNKLTLTRKAATGGVKLYHVCYINSSDEAAHAPAGHSGPLFVALSNVAAGESVALCPLDAFTGTLTLVAGAAIAKGARVAPTGTAGKVAESAGVGPAIAVALEAASADDARFSAMRMPPAARSLYATLENSATITDTTTPTKYDKSITLPAGLLKKGDKLRIRAGVRVPSSNSTDTLNLKLFVGGEEIAATGALNITNGDIALIDAEVIVRESGVSGKLAGAGASSIGVIGTATMKPFLKAEAAEDLSGAVQVAVEATYSVDHADNQSHLEHLTVEHIPA